MKSEGIYVEIPIDAPLDELWEHTQNPTLHEQWDLRFTTIEYLPKQADEEPQRFLYATRIGFGIAVSGTGETIGTRYDVNGPYTSALKFWSNQPISLIKSGSGYWKYIPQGETVRFLTWYDYQVRFGAPGRVFDRLLFRPLMGWATAWSFDALRLWLERDVHPAHSLRRTLTQLIIQVTLAVIWIYQGLVPTLLFPDSRALGMLRARAVSDDIAPMLLAAVGLGEVIFGLLFLASRFGKRLHYLNMIILLALGLGAALSQRALLVALFNPVSLTVAMIALSLLSILNSEALPTAGNCLRKPPEK